MKLGATMVGSDGGEECGLTETAKSHAGMENSSVQKHEFGDNCLNGIKWPPEHYQKNSNRACLAFNGSGRLKTTLVTHGGRTSKLPARFIESDPVEELKSKRTLVERRKKGGLSSRKVDKLRKELCKNGRSKSLRETSGEVTEHLRVDQVTGASIEKERRIIGKNLRLKLTPCRTDGCNNCVSARISTTSAFAETSVDIFRTGFGEEVPIKRKRGRPPKKKFIVCELNGDVRNKISPHGKFVMNATKAPIASLSPSKFGVKRKRTDDVCNSRRSCSTSSSDESNVSLPSPRKRGRPPLSRSTCGGSKEDIFKTPNGVRKPWARPLLKAVEGNSLLSSPGKSLDGILASSDKCVTEMKRKLMKVNGVRIPYSDGKDVQRRGRGRPPKNSSRSPKAKKVKKDIFHFTDDEDTSDAMLSTRKMKSPSKLGKIPMGVVSFKKAGLAQKLKKKSLQKAKETLKGKMKTPRKQHSVEQLSGTDLQTMPEQQPVWDIEKVLGMKRNLAGSYEYLVQWKNGTSCWVPAHQLGDYNFDFSRFLQHSCQDLPVVHRLPFRAYWQEDLFAQPADHNLTLSSMEESGENPEEERTLEVPPTCTGKPQQCKEVTVETYDNCVHIIIKRSSSKRSKVNLRIVDAVIVALEEAAEDTSDYVRISGLGEELFCGLDLNTMTNVAAKDEIRKYRRDIDHVRYLVQMIQTFPKPVVASLEKPGQGLGARLFSLFDLVCDEESLSDHPSLEQMLRKGRAPYCFPRLMGHASVSERLLMGQELLGPEMSLQEKVSAVFRDSKFTKELKGTMKAMSVLPRNIKVLESVGETSDEMLSKQEKELLEEQQKIAEECLRDVQSFWQEITHSVPSHSVTVA